MGKFKLKMATQLGEKVSTEAGFTQFPIAPLTIAEANRISVEAKPADVQGISGALIMVGSEVTLIYSTEYNIGFQNFSIAHELGHYFLPGHPEEIIQQGGAHFLEQTSQRIHPSSLKPITLPVVSCCHPLLLENFSPQTRWA
jgi:hypothetical protein